MSKYIVFRIPYFKPDPKSVLFAMPDPKSVLFAIQLVRWDLLFKTLHYKMVVNIKAGTINQIID